MKLAKNSFIYIMSKTLGY